MRLDVDQGDAGLWYVTSPEVRGLLVAGPTMGEALATVPAALRELTAASSESVAGVLDLGDGGTVF